MARFFSMRRQTLYAARLMNLSLREISLQIKRLGLAFSVYMLSMSMIYFTPQKHYSPTHDTSAQDHSLKINKFMLAGEVLPFDSPEILKRYHKEMYEATRPSEINLHMVKSARKWFPLIEPILEKYGVPNDFKYIAAAESKFVYATSIKGAQGFWQMMPSTARELGLEVNEEVDERYNVIRSTEVACRFFKQNHEIFGDWSSVVLAYNMGTYGLLKKIKSQNSDNVHFVKTNKETQRYFFLVLAAKELIENPKKHGYNLKPAGTLSNVRTITISENITNLKAFCAEQKIDFYTLKNYNPWLRSNTLTIKETTRHGSYTLILPVRSELLKEALADVENRKEVKSSDEPSFVEEMEKNIEIKDSTLTL